MADLVHAIYSHYMALYFEDCTLLNYYCLGFFVVIGVKYTLYS